MNFALTVTSFLRNNCRLLVHLARSEWWNECWALHAHQPFHSQVEKSIEIRIVVVARVLWRHALHQLIQHNPRWTET